MGKPPEDKICFFHGLKNVVVFPAVGAYLQFPPILFVDVLAFAGERSLASCLAGGDLDGSVLG